MAYVDKETQEQPLRKLSQIDDIEEELMVSDSDFLMSCSYRICPECGIDHSFRPNFEGIKTSIGMVSKLLEGKNNNDDNNKAKILEVGK
jgi:hypothetical protein